MLNITVVVGNPKPNSRTRRIAEKLAAQIVRGGSADIRVIDLADYAQELFQWPCDSLSELSARVSRSTLVIFASPTYKATYTGLLKAFLDRYPAGGLRGTTAVALMTGADLAHSLAPTTTLVPLLIELGAMVPMNGLYFNTTHMDRMDSVVASYVAEFCDALAQIKRLHEDLNLAIRSELEKVIQC